MSPRRLGDLAVAAVPLGNLALWVVVPPPDDGRSRFARQLLGEAVGSTAVILLATSLLLSTRARFLEPLFGGLDKMYRAHRHAGQAAMALLAGHVAMTPWRLTPGGGVPAGMIAFAGLLVLVVLTIGPRLPVLGRVVGIRYRCWRRSHRLIGAFVGFSLAHVMLVDPLARTSPPLFAVLLAAYGVGLGSYLYGLLVAPFVRPTYRYRVAALSRLNATTAEVTLRPRKRRRLAFRSGQFVFVTFRRWGLREPHPFTVSSAPAEELLRLTIKAAGDYTWRLYRRLETGRRATIEGAYGMLDYRRGRQQQLWVAGGVGITPFLSWLRDRPGQLPAFAIDFFYTVRTPADALFWDEVQELAGRHDRLRVHLHLSGRDGSLTAARIAAAVAGRLAERDVYLCGPVPMVRALQRQLRHTGVPAAAIHFEELTFR